MQEQLTSLENLFFDGVTPQFFWTSERHPSKVAMLDGSVPRNDPTPPVRPDGQFRELNQTWLARRMVDTTDVNEHRSGHAVQAWLDSRTLDVGAYVVLDDPDEGFGPNVPIVLCDPERGLSDPVKVEELRA